MLMTIGSFLLALFLLILVHEYGHYLVARWCGVKVLCFSFGFGKVLARFRNRHGTVFALSAFPIGGYVRMLDTTEGDVPANECAQAFDRKPVWSRIAIVAAGPVFNFVFAFMALWMALMIGFKTVAPIVGEVRPGSVAAMAGLQANQEIVRFGDSPIASWRDFYLALMPLAGTTESVPMTVRSLTGGAQSVLQFPAGHWHQDDNAPDFLANLGITPFALKVPPAVGEVMSGSPAAAAGFRPGDRVLSVDDTPVDDWTRLVKTVRHQPGAQLKIRISRAGDAQVLTVKVGEQTRNGKQEGYLGLLSQKTDWPKDLLRIQRELPWQAVGTAFRQTLDMIGTTFILTGRFITGKLSAESVSGPVGIAKGAGDSARNGLAWYLSFLALVSISLGVLNLLPIPLLDGGHLMYYAVEVVLRRPVPQGVKTAGAFVGLVFLVALMALALTNDISRLMP